MSPVPDRAAAEVADGLAIEFPGLSLTVCRVVADTKRSPDFIREQLSYMSDKVVGSHAVELRRTPIAHAYRVFYRQIGIDPDEIRTPVEATTVKRLHDGRFRSEGLLADVLTIATVESGAGLIAFDEQAVEGEVRLRLARGGDEPSRAGALLDSGTIVIADQNKPLAPLFGHAVERAMPGKGTKRAVICAIGVQGVPDLVIDEALWKCSELLRSARGD